MAPCVKSNFLQANNSRQAKTVGNINRRRIVNNSRKEHHSRKFREVDSRKNYINRRGRTAVQVTTGTSGDANSKEPKNSGNNIF